MIAYAKARRYSSERERQTRQEMAILEALYRQMIDDLKAREALKASRTKPGENAHETNR